MVCGCCVSVYMTLSGVSVLYGKGIGGGKSEGKKKIKARTMTEGLGASGVYVSEAHVGEGEGIRVSW